MTGDFLRSECALKNRSAHVMAIVMIAVVACGIAPRVGAQVPLTCEVLAPPTPSGLEAWDKDFSYDLRVQQTAAGLSVHVIGDKILVNARNTASLTRSPADAT